MFFASHPAPALKPRRPAGFTLLELLVAASVSTVLGLVMYGVATESVAAFARNVSINRSYSNARQTIDRIGVAMQSAAHVPILMDAMGTDDSLHTPNAGIRFWRCSSSPLYTITVTPTLTATSLTLSLIKPGTTTVQLPPPSVGDMITVDVLCFQAKATGVSTTGTTSVVSFSGTIASNTNPALTASALATDITSTTTNASGGKMACLVWSSVAFIAVNNEMRYFRQFVSGTTSVTNPANYEVLTALTSKLGAGVPPLPFSLGPKPSVNVDLYAEAPDYNNRAVGGGSTNSYNGMSTANSYTNLQSALSPRPSTMLRSPY